MMMTFSVANFLLPVPQVVHEDAAPQVVRGGEIGAALVDLGQLVDKIYQRGLLRQHKRRDDDLISTTRRRLLEREPDDLRVEAERVLVELAVLGDRRRLP